MGKKLSNHERACKLSKEILDDFARGEKLSLMLQKTSQLVRFTGDINDQKWINKEITGLFYKTNPDDVSIMIQNGRLWGVGDYKTEHVEVLEESIETQKIRLASTKDPNISYSPISKFDQYKPHSNQLERNIISETIRVNQAILSRIKGRLYKYVQEKYYSLNFTEIATEAFSTIKKEVESKLDKVIPNCIGDLVLTYENLNSNNKKKWSLVATSCRKILITAADHLEPPKNEMVKCDDGVKRNDKHLYRKRLIKWIRKHHKNKRGISEGNLKYLEGLIGAVDGKSADGNKRDFDNKRVAEKIVIYTYLFLEEIISIADKMDKDNKSTEAKKSK